VAFSGAAIAQTQSVSNLNTVVITGKSESMTQGSIESAKDNVKAIPGGASIVDLNQVREGRQSTWSDSLGLAGFTSKTVLARKKPVWQFVGQV
jgi:hypothetical protein